MRKIDILPCAPGILVNVPTEMLPEFKQAFKRAISTWQDCTPEMQDFIYRLLDRPRVPPL